MPYARLYKFAATGWRADRITGAWLAGKTTNCFGLRGKNQLSVAGDAQTILASRVLDDQPIMRAE
jgi:hypothetical protein